jgi:hypothetical protein
MSVQSPSATYTCSAQDCETTFTRGQGYRGSFCSRQCHQVHRHQKEARDILNQLERDHRFCATCFAQHKEVDTPPSGHTCNIGPVDHPGRNTLVAKNCLTGFQHTTHWADEGQRTRSVDAYGRERLVGHGPTCDCGNTHHRQRERALDYRFAFEYAHTTLVEAVAELRAEGKTEARVDRDALDVALIDHLLPVQDVTTVDWERVLAAALTT